MDMLRTRGLASPFTVTKECRRTFPDGELLRNAADRLSSIV
jgi:hypothetical protein